MEEDGGYRAATPAGLRREAFDGRGDVVWRQVSFFGSLHQCCGVVRPSRGHMEDHQRLGKSALRTSIHPAALGKSTGDRWTSLEQGSLRKRGRSEYHRRGT